MTQGGIPVYVIASKKGYSTLTNYKICDAPLYCGQYLKKSAVQHLINLIILSWSNLMKLRDVTIIPILFDKNEYTMS